MKSTSAIYAITHVASGRRYIGSARNLRLRWALHREQLREGKHHSRYLQRAWDKYGPEAFTFEALEECEPARLLEREQYWLDATKSYEPERGFNVCKVAGSSLGVKRTPETRAKQSALKKGRAMPWLNGREVTLETRERLRRANLGKTYPDRRFAHGGAGPIPKGGVRGPMSEAHKAKISTSKRGVKLGPRSPEHSTALWAARRASGKVGHTEETRAKIRAAKVGRPQTTAHREAIGAALRGQPKSQAVIDGVKAAWADPAKRQARLAAIAAANPTRFTGGHHTPEAKAKIAAASRARKGETRSEAAKQAIRAARARYLAERAVAHALLGAG